MESFRFLGSTIFLDLKWSNHIDSVAQQRLYFLHQLRNFKLPLELLMQFYTAVIESGFCTSITVWIRSAVKSDIRRPLWATEKYWCCPTHPSRTVYIQIEKKKSLENRSGFLTSSLNFSCLADGTEHSLNYNSQA